MVQSPQFYLDANSLMSNDTTTFISGSNLENLTKMLNSEIIFTVYKLFYAGGGLGDKGVRVKKTFLESLPLPLDFSINSDSDNGIEEEIIDFYSFTENEINFISSSVNSNS